MTADKLYIMNLQAQPTVLKKATELSDAKPLNITPPIKA